MRAGRHLKASRAPVTRLQPSGRRTFTQQSFRQLIREQALADSRRSREKIGMRQPPALDDAVEDLDQALMSANPLPRHSQPPGK